MPSAQLPLPPQGDLAPPGHSRESEDTDAFIRDYTQAFCTDAFSTYCVPVSVLGARDQEKSRALLAPPGVT